jgi:hypothetical protein
MARAMFSVAILEKADSRNIRTTVNKSYHSAHSTIGLVVKNLGLCYLSGE